MFSGIDPGANVVLWSLVSIQVAGLVSAWLARVTLGARRAAAATCQVLFYMLLSLVALSTIVTLSASPSWWLLSGGTLAVMILTAVCDFRTDDRQFAEIRSS